MRKGLYFFLIFAQCYGAFEWYEHTRLHEVNTYLINKREYRLAAENYEKLIKIDPENRTYLLGAASNYAKAGNFAKAEYWYMITLHIYPDDIVTQLDLSQLYIAEGYYEQAYQLGIHVLNEDPENVRALIILLKVSILLGNTEEAERYLSELNALDPSDPDVRRATSNYHLSQQDYQAAYDYIIDEYALDEREEVSLQLWGIRPYVEPSYRATIAAGEEQEDDLELRIKTTQINIWSYLAQAIYPVTNTFRTIIRANYGPERQKNLLSGDINYHVDTYAFSAGFEVEFPPNWRLTVNSNQKWGTNKGDVVFPFPTTFSWEPSVALRFASPGILFSLSASKDTFIGRDFDNSEAFFVSREMARVLFELRSDKSYSRLGCEGGVGFYGGEGFDNLKREGQFWGIWDANQGNLHNMFEYRFTYGNFWEIDPDYNSYRARWQHIGRYTMLKIFPGKGEVGWSYRFMRQTLRDFTTESEAIIGQPEPPTPIKRNVMNAHLIELNFALIIDYMYEIAFRGNYYKDTNDYVAGSGRLDFTIQF